uniref:Uncharacterized protein n=1 Tax=Sphaerodactylus townsendi TaxID=933632 RepID=A0ACB8FY94_9SAUR
MSGLLPMAWALVLLLVLSYPSGSTSQPVLTQTPSASSSLGETVHLPCSMPFGTSIGDYRVHWHQQKSGGVPVFLYHYYTSSDQARGSGIPERFTVSPDTSKNRWNLVITGVHVEDDADYYCSTWDLMSLSYHSDAGRCGRATKT